MYIMGSQVTFEFFQYPGDDSDIPFFPTGWGLYHVLCRKSVNIRAIPKYAKKFKHHFDVLYIYKI